MSLLNNHWHIPPSVCRKNGFTFDKETFKNLRESFSKERKELFSDLIRHSNDLDNPNFEGVYKLYPSQIEVLKYIRREIYYLALLFNTIGSGKTSLVPLIAYWLSKNSYLQCGSQMIFTCALLTVIYETAEICLGMDIPFVFAYLEEKDNKSGFPNIIYIKSTDYSISTEKPTDINLIICDPFVAYQILFVHNYRKMVYNSSITLAKFDNLRQIEKAPTDIVLFYDEATYRMDQRAGTSCDLFTKIYIHIMRIAPPRTIKASGTMPSLTEMPVFYNKIAKKYIVDNTEIHMKSFTSSDFQIGCHLIRKNGTCFLPHQNVKDKKSLDNLMKLMDTIPFLNRFYTPFIVEQMMKNADMKYSFKTQNECQQIAKNILSSLNEELLEDFCSHRITHPFGKNTISMKSIIDTHKKEFSTGTLMVGSNCLILATEFLKTIDDMFKFNFDPVNEYDKYKTQNEKIQKSRNKMSSSIKANEKEKAEFLESDTGIKWHFPPKYQLMTAKHLGEFTGAFILQPEELDDIVDQFKNHKWILKLLCHGVGIFSLNHKKILGKRYLEKVLSLYRRKVLRVLIGDGSCAYGTNLSFDNMLFYENDFGKKSIVECHSLKTQLQLMGRIGRTGLSTKANIYIICEEESMLINKILNHIDGIKDPDGKHDEIRNLNLGLRYEWPEIIGETPLDKYLFLSNEIISCI